MSAHSLAPHVSMTSDLPSLVQAPRTAVLTCVRNEGMWLLEWVAYHRAIGFDAIFVASNDCTDGSDLMLDRLHAMGEVIHLRNAVPPGVAPQVAGCALALAHPAMAQVDWAFHGDVDEFLNVTAGAGRVTDLLDAAGPADCIAVSWQMFGSSGLRRWPGGLVLDRFRRAEARLRPARTLQKCLFRPLAFGAVECHMPKQPRRPVVLRNTAGVELPPHALSRPGAMRLKGMARRQVTWANARVNHYAIRSLDSFLLKNLRGDGMGLAHDKYLRGSDFWRFAERNEAEETAILRHLPAVRAGLDRLRADPVIAGLEARAVAEFETLRQRALDQQGRFGWNDPDPAPEPDEV